ncbi:MAG: hypothetical protein KBT33_05245 [Prevotellaceae bacterium]|nr:hypothetical protein [Candidatus Minthosoma equi]
MNTHIKHILAAAFVSMASTAAIAQNLNTGYFNEGYLYRHDVNPAFGNDQGYIAMPGIGNLDLNIASNLPIDKVLYKVNGRTATFMHPQVNSSEFLNAVNENNRIAENLRLQIIGFGFKGWGGYNTFEINARENLNLNVPGSFLKLAKEGVENKRYDISDMAGHVDGYAEIALGHSRQVNDNLRVGGKMKFLLGIANIDANFNKAELNLGENEYTGTVDAEIRSSVKAMSYKTEEKMRGAAGEEIKHKYVSGIDFDSWGVNGFGFAVDLGAEYKLDDNWKFSAAVLDLGYIHWNTNYLASTNGEQYVSTDTYIFSGDNRKDNYIDNEGDRLVEGLSKLYELQDMGDQGGRSKALQATMNFGAQYTPDFYDKMNFGLLSSTRVAGKYSWTEVRLSANVMPTKAFSASTNMALGTYGFSFGWLVNVHPKGFNIFLGTDHQFGKVCKQALPLSGKANVNFGINIPIN